MFRNRVLFGAAVAGFGLTRGAFTPHGFHSAFRD